jgi:hypothetical protein
MWKFSDHYLFSNCKSLSVISFESTSRLTQIKSYAFSSSSLESIEIPRDVRSIDASAFIGPELYSISIETGYDRFVIESDILIDFVDHGLICHFPRPCHIEIMNTIEIVG